MALLTVARLLFLVVNYEAFRSSSGTEIVKAFLYGYRFDFSTAMLTLTAPLLLVWIPAPQIVRSWLNRISSWLLVAVIVVASIILAGDIFFFGESSHHVTIEPIDLIGDLRPMAKTLWDGYLIVCMVMILILATVLTTVFAVYRRSRSAEGEIPGWNSKRLYIVLPVLVLSFLGARGGWQKEPLKSADAVIGESTQLSNIVLNGWYSFLTEMVKSKRPSHFMDESEAISVVRNLVDADGEYDSVRFPLKRTITSKVSITDPGEPLNVVLIIVESLNDSYLHDAPGGVKVMPFLDSLSKHCLYYNNFQSLSTRSFRGVTAILTSFPNLAVDAYRLTFMLPKMRGMGTIFRENGYSVRFMHAAPVNSMGITAVCRISGYSDFVSEEDFPKGLTNGSWGIWDDIALMRMSQEMDTMREPFNYGIFTLCTHSPWTLPEGFSPPFGSETESDDILNTFAYLDKSLEEFFQRESSLERFDRTLYVIVGDHTTHASEEERYHIASLFYAPGRLNPRVDSRRGDQMDILPTVLDLCGITTDVSGFGKSLFGEPDSIEWNVHYQSNLLNYQWNDFMLVSSLSHNFGLYKLNDIYSNGQELMDEKVAIVDKMTYQVQAIYQVSDLMMSQNRITP